MTEEILNRLEQIERTYQVKIVYACESGSRAWGFESNDSDYDVRFIYVHHEDWYLSTFPKRDVIEEPINDLLDISGWELRKALLLSYKSNPALLEWMYSPTVYIEQEEFQIFRECALKSFKSIAAYHHYLSMVRSNINQIREVNVRLKKYMYTLRPLLCAKWVIEKESQPPTVFEDLLEYYLPNGEIRNEINELLHLKKDTNEVKTVRQNQILNQYIFTEFDEMVNAVPNIYERVEQDYDAVLRQLVRSA